MVRATARVALPALASTPLPTLAPLSTNPALLHIPQTSHAPHAHIPTLVDSPSHGHLPTASAPRRTAARCVHIPTASLYCEIHTALAQKIGSLAPSVFELRRYFLARVDY